MQLLNLPTYPFKIKSSENKQLIFDIVRKKYVLLTPEEWVRQHFIWFLVEEKKYPTSLTSVEKKLTINNLTKRTDIVVFKNDGSPFLLVECKAPTVKITQETFDQIARYNLNLNANYLIVTNGLEHFFCELDFTNKKYIFLITIPNYQK